MPSAPPCARHARCCRLFASHGRSVHQNQIWRTRAVPSAGTLTMPENSAIGVCWRVVCNCAFVAAGADLAACALHVADQIAVEVPNVRRQRAAEVVVAGRRRFVVRQLRMPISTAAAPSPLSRAVVDLDRICTPSSAGQRRRFLSRSASRASIENHCMPMARPASVVTAPSGRRSIANIGASPLEPTGTFTCVTPTRLMSCLARQQHCRSHSIVSCRQYVRSPQLSSWPAGICSCGAVSSMSGVWHWRRRTSRSQRAELVVPFAPGLETLSW